MADFREYVDSTVQGRKGIHEDTAESHTEKAFSNVGLVRTLNAQWDQLWKAPFFGITTDGHVKQDLYSTQDDVVDIHTILDAAKAVLGTLTKDQHRLVNRPLDSPERRAWSNPELYVHRFGVRLDRVPEKVALSVMHLVKTTLSEQGFHKAMNALRINHFLGEIIGAPRVLNMYAYNFLIFSTPSATEPWGWMLYGHHLCLNVFLHKTQIVLSPTFTGAEPNMIDEGPFAGTSILQPEAKLGLTFMQKLPQGLRSRAHILSEMDGRGMPSWRWNPADQRHLCGAFQDNRIVPYEGLCLSNLDTDLTALLLKLVEQFVLYLPDNARTNRMTQVSRHLNETYFCWIGKYGDTDPYYYRIQSPVIICEFDHHSGVFLSNARPAKFHIHTIVRTPNGGDYGYAVLKKLGFKYTADVNASCFTASGYHALHQSVMKGP